MRRICFLALLLVVLAFPAKAQQRTVDLELVLLSDSSGSIDQAEIAFQNCVPSRGVISVGSAG